MYCRVHQPRNRSPPSGNRSTIASSSSRASVSRSKTTSPPATSQASTTSEQSVMVPRLSATRSEANVSARNHTRNCASVNDNSLLSLRASWYILYQSTYATSTSPANSGSSGNVTRCLSSDLNCASVNDNSLLSLRASWYILYQSTYATSTSPANSGSSGNVTGCFSTAGVASFRPTHCAQCSIRRRPISPRYSPLSSRSIPTNRNPSKMAAHPVEHEPANGSSTSPPGRVVNRTNHLSRAKGFMVGW